MMRRLESLSYDEESGKCDHRDHHWPSSYDVIALLRTYM